MSNLIDRYNNRADAEKLRIPYRGKSKHKVIKHIHTAQYNIGQEPVLQLCIEEFKDGYDDMYLRKLHQREQPLTPDDHLGSDRNYALMYPISPAKRGCRRSLVIAPLRYYYEKN